MSRKLPNVGETVSYTRDALPTFPGRAHWRGTFMEFAEGASDDWPIARIEWFKPTRHESTVNLKNLCTTRSVAFVEESGR